jgi:hypothetical protein
MTAEGRIRTLAGSHEHAGSTPPEPRSPAQRDGRATILAALAALTLVLTVSCQQATAPATTPLMEPTRAGVAELRHGVAGELRDGDELVEGRYAHRYMLDHRGLDDGTEVTLIMHSHEFPPLLRVLDAATGEVVAESEAADGARRLAVGGGSAQVRYRVAGEQHVLASSLVKAEGRYTLAWCTRWVTTAGDAGPGSLREAVANAPARGAICFDTARFQPAAPTHERTIALESEIVLATDVWIHGPGPDAATVAGNGTSRVFTVSRDTRATLSSLTIQGGRAEYGGGVRNHGALTLLRTIVTDNHGRLGGGIYNAGDLSLRDSLLTANAVTASGGPHDAAAGGGIYNAGTLQVTGSSLVANTADWNGGGIYSYYAAAEVSTSTLAHNHAARHGGGVASVRGQLTLDRSSLHNNTAGAGGGLFNSGTLMVRDGTIAGNTAATGAGGGMLNLPYGIIMVSLEDTTVVSNAAAGHGGGIYNGGRDVQLTLAGASVVTGNVAGASGNGHGGGIYGGRLSGVVEGGNVHGNAPDDVVP